MRIEDGQNIFDVTLANFGTLENLFDFLEDNSLLTTSELRSGQEVVIDNANKGLENIKQKIVTKNLSFNNEQVPIPSDWILATGFWADLGVWDDSAYWID